MPILGHLPSLLYTLVLSLAILAAVIVGCVFAFRSAVDYVIKRQRETHTP